MRTQIQSSPLPKSQSKLESRIAELEATIADLTAAHAKALEDGERATELLTALADCYFFNRNEGMLELMRKADRYLQAASARAALPATTGKGGAP